MFNLQEADKFKQIIIPRNNTMEQETHQKMR